MRAMSYSTFHAPTKVFNSARGELTSGGMTLIGKGGKFTNEGAGLIIRGLSSVDLKVLGKQWAYQGVGARLINR